MTAVDASSSVAQGGLRPQLDHSLPAWLRDRRRAAWDIFQTLPKPSAHVDEDWRRTDIAKLEPSGFRVAAHPEAEADPLVGGLRGLRDAIDPNAAFLATTGKGLVACEGLELLTAQGVVVSSIEAAAELHPEQLQRALATCAAGESYFLALWNAMVRGGCFIYVPRGVSAAVPVVAAYGTAGPGAAIFPGSLVVVDDDASLTFIDAYASPADESEILSDAYTGLVLGRNARLDYCVVQQWGPGVWHLSTHRARLDRDARLRLFSVTVGSRLQKTYWEAILDGAGADAELAGVCFGDGTQHLDHQSLQDHRAPSAHSNLLLKVAVRDRARSVYSGMIVVAKEAQGTDAYVANRNLLLSPGAKADSVPRLEIKANDVRCGHGATAGHIDDDQRFYLESRGVPRDEADRLIVGGFLGDARAHAPHEGVRRFAAELLDTEIGGAHQAGIAATGEAAG
ncbi:MAG: Fe-S cluster assembly protein SufD [Candidatus Dormibacteraeota bacterium]|nr:Fe-S cluster assembly protein SufD [Candidatus Dormibacteraeota bacterium]